LSRFLRFRNVRIHRAPGIQPGFSVDRLSEGLNLVVGPNGIGKSTVARAIQRFLWSDASEASGIEYSAEIERDGEVSVGEVHHGRTAWSAFATACGEPKLADRYHLRIDRLLQDSEQAGDLFENVLRELRGGVNIKELRDQFPKKRLPSSTVGEAQRALATAQNAAHGADRRREVELPDLRAQLDAATAALNNQNRLLSLRELLSTTLDYEQLRQKTESVPEFVRELIEISIPTLNQIESELAKAELEADRLVRVEAAQAQPGCDAPPVDPARDATLARWREQLSGLEGDLRNLRAEWRYPGTLTTPTAIESAPRVDGDPMPSTFPAEVTRGPEHPCAEPLAQAIPAGHLPVFANRPHPISARNLHRFRPPAIEFRPTDDGFRPGSLRREGSGDRLPAH
jgi:DNA repair protein SbcC/Rad50